MQEWVMIFAIIGSFGVGKMTENWQKLLEFRSYYDLVVTNSYFKTKPQHKVCWSHTRSKKWHQIYLILTRRSSLKDITYTRSNHSANCDTDHSLLCYKLKLQDKYFYLNHVIPSTAQLLTRLETNFQDMWLVWLQSNCNDTGNRRQTVSTSPVH